MYTCTIGSPCSDACTLCTVHYTSNTSYTVTCFVMKNRAQGGMTMSVSYMGHCTELSLTCSCGGVHFQCPYQSYCEECIWGSVLLQYVCEG